jgi:predicted phosphodiesterase
VDNTIQHLGEIKGKILVFGGVYSNFQALEELAYLAKKEDIPAERIFCTGDIVGYCASPVECLEFIQKWGIHAIQGNVEENLVNGTEDCGCNFSEGSRCDVFAKQWFAFATLKMTPMTLAYMENLPKRITFSYAGKNVHLLHGSDANISEFIFGSTPWEIKKANFITTKADVILAGHCGLPFADVKENLFWLNPGVIGMPANDGTPRVWYMLLDDTSGSFSYQFKSYEYDSGEANQLMLENGLPFSYADTLLTGIWDNSDILPEFETSQQGISLNLE